MHPVRLIPLQVFGTSSWFGLRAVTAAALGEKHAEIGDAANIHSPLR